MMWRYIKKKLNKIKIEYFLKTWYVTFPNSVLVLWAGDSDIIRFWSKPQLQGFTNRILYCQIPSHTPTVCIPTAPCTHTTRSPHIYTSGNGIITKHAASRDTFRHWIPWSSSFRTAL
jgi:hypothetical protein